MRTSFLTPLLLAWVVLLLDVQAQTVSEARNAEIQETIIAITEDARQASERITPSERVLQSLIESDDAIFITQGDFRKTHRAIIEARQPSSDRKSQEITVEERYVFALSPTSAVLSEHGRYRLTFKDGRVSEGPYALTLTYAELDGEWKMIHAHQSFPPNP